MIRPQVFSAIAVSLLSSFAIAGGYVDSPLKQKLFAQESAHHHPLTYDQARQNLIGGLFLEDHNGSYFVHDVYCQKDYTKSDFGSKSGIGPLQIPDGSILNTEHTWPQSRFTTRFPKDLQKSDLHHLFPSDSQVNGIRGNYKFGEVQDSVAHMPCKTDAALGTAKTGGYRFEPPAVHRGNVARALFYFSTRYQISIDPDEEAALRKWNVEDPADDTEKAQNSAIEKLQGNRNPFIDDPTLADQISDF